MSTAGVPLLLAASTRKAATSLTWEALAASDPDVPVDAPPRESIEVRTFAFFDG